MRHGAAMKEPERPDQVGIALEAVKRAALTYAWSMFYFGIGVGFLLAWLVCSLHARQSQVPSPLPTHDPDACRRIADAQQTSGLLDAGSA
jgi:hypothetical protein